MDMTDDQLDEMLLDKRLEEARARESTPATEPAGEDNEPIQIPYKPGKQPAPTPADRSYLESFGRGAMQGYTSGFPDEITGAVESAITGKNYKTARDESRKAYREAEEANPVTYNAGMIGGAVGQALTPYYNIAAKGGPALQGGLFALGSTEAEEPESVALDVGLGAATGYGTGKLFDKASKLRKYLSNVAEQRAYKAAAGQSKKDIMAEKKAGRIVVDREGISMARGRDLLSKDEAGPPAVGWFDKTENIVPKVAEKRDFFGKAIGEVGRKIDEAIPEGSISYDEIAGIIDREMEKRPNTVENKQLSKRLKNQLDHIFEVETKTKQTPTELGDFLNYLKSEGFESSIEPGILDKIPTTSSTEKIIGKPKLGFREAQDYKGEFQWSAPKNLSRPSDYDYETTLHNAFSEAMENAANRSKESIPEAGKYPYYKGKYASYRGADNQGVERSLQNLTNRFISPSDYAMGVARGLGSIGVGSGAGYAASGDPLGGLIGGAVGALAHKQVRERGSAFAARSANAVAKALESGENILGKYAPILGESMQRGSANFILNHTLLMKSDPEYQRIVESLAQ